MLTVAELTFVSARSVSVLTAVVETTERPVREPPVIATFEDDCTDIEDSDVVTCAQNGGLAVEALST